MSRLILPESIARRRELALDLTRCHFQRDRGQWRIYGTWYLATRPGVPAKRCLVVVDKTKSVNAEAQRPFVLVDDAMYRMHEGEWNMQEVAAIVAKFFLSMGWGSQGRSRTERKARADFLSLIVDHLDDLKDMPMAPRRPKADLGEIEVRIGGKKLRNEVKVDV